VQFEAQVAHQAVESLVEGGGHRVAEQFVALGAQDQLAVCGLQRKLAQDQAKALLHEGDVFGLGHDHRVRGVVERESAEHGAGVGLA